MKFAHSLTNSHGWLTHEKGCIAELIATSLGIGISDNAMRHEAVLPKRKDNPQRHKNEN